MRQNETGYVILPSDILIDIQKDEDKMLSFGKNIEISNGCV